MLKTSVIGSYAPPAWLITALEAMKLGEYGASDIKETFDCAVDLAIRDQEDAGIDIITDGEMRRLGFFTAGFYERLTGLTPLEYQRKLGPGGHDQRERYKPLEPFSAPNGLGIVDEFLYSSSRTNRPMKVTCPGPYTLSGRIQTGTVYKDRVEVAKEFVHIINSELKQVVDHGATLIQLDEPSAAVHKNSPEEYVELFNQSVKGINAEISIHLCFGNYLGRPVAHRTYAPLFPSILDMAAQEIHLEFANREMVELELATQIAESGRTVAAGVIDVKNYFVETPEIVADRIRTILNHVPADQLVLSPDCGFSETARWASRAKLHSLVDGVRIINEELGFL
ncbi:MAG: cobalamin-independent methionine synthase II family protein [Bacteroidetes bacterium]|nr:cobalamin-independent methionine synthase II family protein [Bacteroidota bacterium]